MPKRTHKEAPKEKPPVAKRTPAKDGHVEPPAKEARLPASEGAARSERLLPNSEQLVALDDLHMVYWNEFHSQFPATRSGLSEREAGAMLHAAWERADFAEEGIEDARARALASGYPVPDNWLTVDVVGSLRQRADDPARGCQSTYTVETSGPDREALRAVLGEISAARLRLEAKASQVPDSSQDDKGDVQRMPEGKWSLPMSLNRIMERLSAESMSTAKLKTWLAKTGLREVTRQSYQVRLDTLSPNQAALLERKT